MKYIKKVILENFQSHKYTEIEFDQYLNVIVGPSDHGKTAIIRALKWALFNEPSGDFFIREGEKECSVSLIFSDGTKVKRYRSKTKNAYYLYTNEGEEITFEGFGTNVPEEIMDSTSMRKVNLDSNNSNSINIGEQLEGPFLLSEKNATKANAIGRLVGVHIVDDALKDSLKDIRNLNIKVKNHEEILKGLESDLNEYDYLDDLIQKSKLVEDLKKQIYNNQQKLNRLIQLCEDINRINKKIVILQEYLERLDNIDSAIYIEKKLTNCINNYNYIHDKYEKLNRINRDIKDNSNLLLILKDIDGIDKVINTINISWNKMSRLDSMNMEYKYVKKNIIEINIILDRLKNINDIDQNLNLIEKNYLKLAELLNLKYKLDNINKSLSIGIVFVEKLKAIDSIFTIKDRLELTNNRLMKLLDLRNKYQIINTEKLKNESQLMEINSRMEIKLEEYKIILTRLEVCPLCFNTINKSELEKIVNNYR